MKPKWLYEGRCNHTDAYTRALQTPASMVSGLLGLCASIALSGCMALKGVSGPGAWQATDLRVVEREPAGALRDIYAFTLVLTDTQGAAVTFTQLDQNVSQPGVNTAGVTTYAPILWRLILDSRVVEFEDGIH